MGKTYPAKHFGFGDILHKGVEFLHTISGPEVGEEKFQGRLLICLGCSDLIKKDEKIYCGLCGCAHWSGSELRRKLRWLNLRCPKLLW